jgi:hypothetical protein
MSRVCRVQGLLCHWFVGLAIISLPRIGRFRRLVVWRMVAFGEWLFGEWSPSEIGSSKIGRSEIGCSENGRLENGRCTKKFFPALHPRMLRGP